MDCKEANDKLNAFLDRELPPEASAELQGHLAACPQCASALEELKRLNRALDSLHGMAVAGDFAQRVRETAGIGAQGRAARVFTLRRLTRVLTGVAAGLAVVVGLWFGIMMGRAVGPNASDALQVEEAQAEELDLEVEALSSPLSGSIAEVCLVFAGESN